MGHIELYGSKSLCCLKLSRTVVSRSGGFVSQNCTVCYKAPGLEFCIGQYMDLHHFNGP